MEPQPSVPESRETGTLAPLAPSTQLPAPASNENSHQANPEPSPNFWLTGLEVAIGLGGGALWYVIDDRNVLDWDKPSLKQRLNGEAWRMDNNNFAINYVFHPLSGAGFHAIARSNDLGFWSAGATSAIGSTLWEYVIEFNEKVSINDMMVTPGGGVVIGEFVHKMASYLNDVPPRSNLHNVARWTLGPTVALNRAVRDRPQHDDRPRDGNGFSGEYWHDFTTTLGWAWLNPRGDEPTNTLQRIAFDGELVSMHDYRAPVAMDRWFYQGEISRLSIALTTSQGALDGEVSSEVLLGGFHHQSLYGPVRQPNGIALTSALALRYLYRSSNAHGFDDRQGVLSFPGPSIDLYARREWLGARLHARFSPDFAGVSSVASSQGLAARGSNGSDATIKTIVQREGYFYAWGFSTTWQMYLQAGPVWSEAQVRVGQYDSIEGLDRAQERVVFDIDLDEIISEYSYGVGVMPANWVGIAVNRKVNQRESWAGAHSTSVRVEELGFSIHVNF